MSNTTLEMWQRVGPCCREPVRNFGFSYACLKCVSSVRNQAEVNVGVVIARKAQREVERARIQHAEKLASTSKELRRKSSGYWNEAAHQQSKTSNSVLTRLSKGKPVTTKRRKKAS